jgi:hypothetical protein
MYAAEIRKRRVAHMRGWHCPKQNSSGGKPKLGRISKMGNRYLRKLRAFLNLASKRGIDAGAGMKLAGHNPVLALTDKPSVDEVANGCGFQRTLSAVPGRS